MKHRLRRVIAFLRLKTYSDNKGCPRRRRSNSGVQRLSLKTAAHEKRQTSDFGACLYVYMKFNAMSKRTVKVVISLTDACFAVIDSSSAGTEFGADFGLSHSVHIAVQYGNFQRR